MKRTSLYTLDLEQLLAEVNERQLFLVPARNGRVKLWSPDQRVPLAIRQAVSRHNRELKRLIGISDPRVCPSRELHCHAEIYAVMRVCCPFCAMLAPSVRRAC